MEIPLNNITSHGNISILNSIILNNYSIQNVIISPKKIASLEKLPLNSENYYQVNKVQNSVLSTPYNTKKIITNINIPTIQYKYTTPISSAKISSIFNHLKNKQYNSLKQPIEITKTSKKKKHPEDSIKKNKVNKKSLDIRNVSHNIKLKKNLKSSMSQGFFEEFKKRKGTVYNISLEHKSRKNHIKKEPKNSLSKKQSPKKSINKEPNLSLDLKEFKFVEQIGKGTFGNIFCVKWNKSNKLFALKKEILFDIEDIHNRNKAFKIMQSFVKKTGSTGTTIIYGNLCLKTKNINKNINNNINIKANNNMNHYIYYELMEKAERDWDNEIDERRKIMQYYSEKEILNIMIQLIETLSLMQKNHITNRDIKPQNVLVFNGRYKLCDFGEIRVLERAGIIVQRVRGSELYMSPILFQGLHRNLIQVRHNTYKSDVFSLGMCLFYACCLTYTGVDSIREVNDMSKIKEILFECLYSRYSEKLILFILSMLEIDENKRFNFIQLEEKLKMLF